MSQMPSADPTAVLWADRHENGRLIPLLQQVQDKKGYIPREEITRISKETKIAESKIFGVVTFYKQFRLNPLGKFLIRLCDGTACHVNDSKGIMDLIVEELNLQGGADTTEDGLFTLEPVACLGCCSLAPVIMINDETYGRLTPLKVREILDSYRKQGAEAAAG